jgi:hypothetical protein
MDSNIQHHLGSVRIRSGFCIRLWNSSVLPLISIFHDEYIDLLKTSLLALSLVLVLPMCIRDVVTQALTTGLLTLEAEEQLRSLLSNKYGYEDLQAFMALQSAAMVGQVEQESRLALSSTPRSPRLPDYCRLP